MGSHPVDDLFSLYPIAISRELETFDMIGPFFLNFRGNLLLVIILRISITAVSETSSFFFSALEQHNKCVDVIYE
jgi:hypothetical protein